MSPAERILTVMVGLAFLALPFGVEEWLLGELSILFAYALFAASLAFVWGHGGLLCLGQALFFGLGAYAMGIVTLGLVPGAPWLLSAWVGLAAAILIPAVIAYMLGRFFFASGGLKGAFFGIATLAVAFVAERAFINWDYTGGLNGLIGVPPFALGINGDGYMVFDLVEVYYLALGVLAFGMFLLSSIKSSRWGLAVKAIATHELRAEALGYDVSAYKTAVFSIGAAVAGLSGALFVVQFGFASPTLMGFSFSAEVLIWVALGGRGMLAAAAGGAVLVRLLEANFASLFGDTWLLVLGALFVLVVMTLPRGLLGELIHRLDVLIKSRR
ncbi:MAG: branched-chain amino acid ABC transporter permease [Pseudomonadota bacterium]